MLEEMIADQKAAVRRLAELALEMLVVLDDIQARVEAMREASGQVSDRSAG